MQEILFVDLDGTIRRPKSGEQFIQFPKDQEAIPGAKEAITKYSTQGYLIVGITNQGGVAAKHKSLDDCIKEQQETLKLFPEIHSILFCPDFEGEKCYRCYRDKYFDCTTHYPRLLVHYRKPGLGMIDYVLTQGEIHPSDCLMVGDSSEDEACAEAAGVTFIEAEKWRSTTM